MIAAWEWAPLTSGHGRTFSRLSEPQRATFTERAAASDWQRGLLVMLKTLCVSAYTASPEVARAIGFTESCLDESPPRTGPRLRPITWPAIKSDVTVRADVVVIGSGAGGAVVAKELAERGISVIVLEEGGYFTQEDFRAPIAERMRTLYRDGGMTVALGRPPVPVPIGKGIGGTTLVNSGTCFRAPDGVLREWESKWGIEGASPAAMAPLFDRVEQTLHVMPVPEALLGENARVFRRGLTSLGLHGEPIRRNIDGCRGCGVCAFGCPSDAKQAMHLSYLPRAETAGAVIYARCRARRILRQNGRAAGVEADILADTRSDPDPERVRGRLTVRAERVVLAAGAIHTPLLLMDNGLASRGGPVGRELRVHPAVGVTAVFDEDVFGWRGTLQPFFLDEFRESHGLMFEVTSPLPGASASALPGVGAALKEALADYRKVASVGLFVADSSTGRVRRLPGGAPLVTYALNAEDTRRLLQGIAMAAKIFFAAGARRVHPGVAEIPEIDNPGEIARVTEGGWKASSLPIVGFHPLGTARMGRDPQSCAVDPWGESHALPGLYVADGSILPGCPGVNPQITIMAMATRIAARLAERMGAHAAPAP